MAPNIKERYEEVNEECVAIEPKAAPREYKLVYPVILIFGYWHIGALYGLYLALTSAKLATILFNICIYITGGLGVTAGTHRLWAHRAYKAKLPLQILLMLFQTMACQKTVLNWVRDHRIHHRFVDTDADPHNATRGLFFSHIGWLLTNKHPDVIKEGKQIDMSDLSGNPVLQFQKKYYLILMILLVFIMPVLVPVVFWQESVSCAHHVHLVTLVFGTHVVLCTNSIAHAFGSKPYDSNISPTQSLPLTFFSLGEGYHNYHHVFPSDYRTSELGNNYMNLTTKFIDLFAKIGWAYDLKYASDDLIEKRSVRTGDGTDLWGRVKDGLEVDKSM